MPLGASRAGLMSVAGDDIPDELEHQWDTRESNVSDGTIESVPDQIGDIDLTAENGPDFVEGGLNGEDVAVLNGSDQAFSYEFPETFQRPATMFFVISHNDKGGSNQVWRDENVSGNRNEFRLRPDDGETDTFVCGPSDTDVSEAPTGDQIWTIAIDDDSEVVWRLNGSVIKTDDDASDSDVLADAVFGNRPDLDQGFDGAFAEVAVAGERLEDSDISQYEEQLESDWGMDVLS